MKRTPFAAKPAKRMKSSQRNISPEDKRYWSKLAGEVGCVACMLDGGFNPHVSIHHIDGRTKPGCHSLVLPLCGSHHQDDGDAIAVHPHKARFEAKYGTQMELKARCDAILSGKF
jgi:hypothetical protein